MSDLASQTPANTYKGLLQVNDYTNGVDATAKYVQDGEGTDSALAISSTAVGIGTTSPTKILTVQEALSGSLSLSAFSNDSSTANSTVGIDLQTDEGEGNRTRARIVSGADGSNAGYLSLCTRKDINGLNASIDEKMRVKNDGTINFSNVSTYADDTAAGTGGLVAGDVYKTSAGELRIKL